MSRPISRARAAASFLLCLLLGARSFAGTPLTVSAAASLEAALTEIAPLHARAHPTVTVTFNFGGSGALQRQIEAGAPVDVFFSAAPKQMDALAARGRLLAGTRRDLLRNALVLITPRTSALVTAFPDLARPEVKRVAIGEPRSVPAGAYAAELFAHLGLTAALEPKFIRMLDVRQVLTAVETGNADAGVVYLTDARQSQKVRVAATAPPAAHAPIAYPVAVVSETKHAAEAQAFVKFLSGGAARAVFERLGFRMAR